MNIPNFIDEKFVDKDGNLTPGWRSVMSVLISQLQQNFSKEGLMMPLQNTSVINQLNVTEKNGALLYDQDTNEPKIVVNGVIKKIQLV